MKILAAAIVLTLSTIYPAYAGQESLVPHPQGGKQTLSNGPFSPTRYSFSLHVTGKSLSKLRFTTPEGVKLSQDIQIFDKAGKPLNITTETQGLVTIVTFSQPVKPGEDLSIDLNNVRTIDNSRSWDLSVAGKLDDLKDKISLQTVRMSPASH